MEKVEQFIQEHTRICSNEIGYCHNKTRNHNHVFYSWLTPVHARCVAEIAREEIYEWLANHYKDYMHNPTGDKLEAFFGMDMITDLKQAMKDE